LSDFVHGNNLETKIWLMTHIEKRKERKEKGQKLSQFLNLVKSFKMRQSFFGTSFETRC